MLTINDFNKLIKRVKGKIQLVIGRAVLAAIKNDEKTQKVQVVALYDETITNIERFQEYGLETYPKKEAEVLINFINGNRDQGIVSCIHDRRYRPQNLSEGDVMLYTHENKDNDDFHIHLKTNKGMSIKGDVINIGSDTDHTITITKTGKTVDIVGTGVNIGAASGHKAVCLEDLVDSINTFISTFNSHTHTVAAAPGPTTMPLVPEIALIKVDLVTKESLLT